MKPMTPQLTSTLTWQPALHSTPNRSQRPVAAPVANGRRGSFVGDCVAKVESCRATNFRENQKREEIADSYNLNRATEVAYEFSVWR